MSNYEDAIREATRLLDDGYLKIKEAEAEEMEED